MRPALFSLLLALAVLLNSCAPPAPYVAEIRTSIESMTASMAKEMESGTFDTTMARYADDAIQLPNFGPMLRGKDAIKESYYQMQSMNMTMKDVAFTVTDVQVGLPFAYEVGTYKMTVILPGMPEIPDEGKYLTVWEKTADGSWKIKIESWNTNIRPPIPGADG